MKEDEYYLLSEASNFDVLLVKSVIRGQVFVVMSSELSIQRESELVVPVR